MKSALLKWEVTPDFYVDVYELKRLGFQFRVDDGETPFIEIGNVNMRKYPIRLMGFCGFDKLLLTDDERGASTSLCISLPFVKY